MDSFIVSDFSGGITDDFLSASPKHSAVLHNFFIDEDGHPHTRPGINLYSTRLPVQIGVTRISGIYADTEPFGRPIFIRADKAYNLNESGTFTEIVGPANNNAIPNKTVTSQESLVLWRRQAIIASAPSTVLPHRLYCTDLSPATTFQSLTLGLPALASNPTISGGAGSNNYIYSFHYYYEFTDYDGTTFVEQGPVLDVEKTGVAAPDVDDIELEDIPALTNSGSTNYDISTALKIKVYRTLNNGTTSYLLTTLDNGDTDYTDATADSALETRDTIYTTGDVLSFTPPPVGALYVTQTNDYFWYATTTSLFQSIQGAPGACPEEYETIPGQRIRGLSSILSYPILFCDQSVFRVEGVFDEFGDGGFEFKEISKVAGCLSNRSIVAIPGGLVWAGNGGFWFTDGNSCRRISIHLNKTYDGWKNTTMTGAYDPIKNMVIWTVSAQSTNDSFVALHLNFGLNDRSVFTTWGSLNNIYPSAVWYTGSVDADSSYRNKLLIGDVYGYFMMLDEQYLTDPRLDTTALPSAMAKKAIICRYESAGLDLGGEVNRAFSSVLTYELKNETDVAVQFLARRDEHGAWGTFAETRQDGGIVWGYSEYGWNETTDSVLHSWNSQKLIEGKRHFPNTALRSTRRQIGITNNNAWLSKSDDTNKGTCTVSFSAKTVTLTNASGTCFWPGDCEEYEIAFDTQSYATFFKIKSRDSDTQITVYDPYSALPNTVATLEWQIRGYRKFEKIYLLSYTVHFTPDGMTQLPSVAQSSYQNA